MGCDSTNCQRSSCCSGSSYFANSCSCFANDRSASLANGPNRDCDPDDSDGLPSRVDRQDGRDDRLGGCHRLGDSVGRRDGCRRQVGRDDHLGDPADRRCRHPVCPDGQLRVDWGDCRRLCRDALAE
jgi:hypothetical protein